MGPEDPGTRPRRSHRKLVSNAQALRNATRADLGVICPEGPWPGNSQSLGWNGYAILEFNGEHLAEAVHAPDGTRVYHNDLI
jgi:hypothetical protein